MIKREDSETASDTDYVEIITDEGNVSYRPKLVVNYAFTKFGVDAGGVIQNVTAAYDDKIQINRCFAHGSDPWPFAEFIMNLKHINNQGQNAKTILVYPCNAGSSFYWANYDTGYGQDYSTALPEDYKDFIMFRLNYIESHLKNSQITTPYGATGNASYNLEDVVIGIEIGNEESSQWQQYSNGSTKGANFANYYSAVANEIRSTYPNVKIFSGGSPADGWDLSYSNNVHRNFIQGFIDQVKSNGGNTLDQLPDIVTIHGYDGTGAPEFDNVGNHTTWLKKLKELFDICDDKGYIPNFAQTEYGYCPKPSTSNYSSPWAPRSGASEEAQSIYYLRKTMINALTRPYNGIGWQYDIYYHYPREGKDSVVVDGVLYDFGFFNPGNYPNFLGFVDRPIRDISSKIYNSSDNLQIGTETTEIWAPLQFDEDTTDNDYFAWGSWETSNGQKWGVLWRYVYGEEYYEPSGDTRPFTVPGDFSNYKARSYQFTFSGSDASFTDLSTEVYGSYDLSSNTTTWQISNVTENPMFLKIYQ